MTSKQKSGSPHSHWEPFPTNTSPNSSRSIEKSLGVDSSAPGGTIFENSGRELLKLEGWKMDGYKLVPPDGNAPGGAKGNTKLRPGAAVEVKSKTADAWVPGQVISPPDEGKVQVQFQVAGETLRKSIKTTSLDIRLCTDKCEEKDPASIGGNRQGASWSAAKKEAMRALETLKGKEAQIMNVPTVAARATAAAKWARARKIAESCRSIELWCSGVDSLNGTYTYCPASQGAPAFQFDGNPRKWLFVAMKGSWFIGDTESKDQRLDKGHVRCEAVEPGTLPQDVVTWEVPKNGEWLPHSRCRFWLSESVDVAWETVRVSAFQTPVIEIWGVDDSSANGFYDFVPGDGETGKAPCFQHQQRPDTWLFLAKDQRWWIGNCSAKNGREERGMMYSSPVNPGTHPSEAIGWHVRYTKVWSECRTAKVRKSAGTKRACEKWADASKKARDIQLWGKEFYFGEYNVQDTMDGLPAYQYATDKDIWLYVAMDGCWWLSDTECKDARRARGFLKSDSIEPGTLPQDVEVWRDLKFNSWEASSQVRVLLHAAVTAEWQIAWQLAEKAEVIEIQNVNGPKYNGLYDLLEPTNGKDKPPTFQHQINQELFMYVATDGRWWVSTADCMSKRDPNGRMHSDMIKPGMLPVSQGLCWHIFNRAAKEWERQYNIEIFS